MSTSQLHTMPSVLLVIRLCAFCVPTICMAYTGCVCPAADSGVLSTGKCFDRVSHRRICPEYVPPNIKFEWNGENVTERTSDWMQLHGYKLHGPKTMARTCEWNTNSGRSSKWRFHTATMPSGSFSAAGFLLYDAQQSSGY